MCASVFATSSSSSAPVTVLPQGQLISLATLAPFVRSVVPSESSTLTTERESHNRARLLRLNEIQGGRVRSVCEQALAGSQHDGKDHQVKLVDEVVRQ